jgi:hypothetical protein
VTTSDSEPLLRGSINDTARSLLESAKDDVPDSNARARMLAALAAAPAAPEGGGRLRQLLRSGGYYVHGVGALLILSGVAALMMAMSSDSHVASRERVAPASSATVSAIVLAASADLGDKEAVAIVTPDALPSAPVVDRAAVVEGKVVPKVALTKAVKHPAQTPPSTPDAHESTLAREIAQVEAARLALAAGNVTRTLSLLDQYDREFPTGAFAVEISVLRIEALARAGRSEEARRLGTQFLARHRQGAFARRVAATLDNTNAHGASASSSGNE